MNRTLFVTGTDTGVGKTRVSCALLHAFRARGIRAAGMKPVAAGVRDTPEGPRHDDALALIAASTDTPRYATVNPYLFVPPIAPHLAAAEAGASISLRRIADCHAELMATHHVLVVEGAGGLLVPLGPGSSVADIPKALGAAVILVVGLRLGCLNHALLTVEAIAARGLSLLAWVGSAVDPAFERVAANLATLEACIPAPCWGVLLHRADADAQRDSQDLDSRRIDDFCRCCMGDL